MAKNDINTLCDDFIYGWNLEDKNLGRKDTCCKFLAVTFFS